MHPFIKKLLNGQDVEWKTLGEVAEINKGTQLNKSLLTETGKYPVINGGINPSGFWHEYNNEADNTVISQGGASAGYVNWLSTPFFAGAHAYVVKCDECKVLKRYVYHFLKMNQEKFMERQYGAGIPALAKSDLVNLKLPLPPLSVQTEIVRILDAMTALTAELTAELSLRQKQYNFYREKLLNFENQEGGAIDWLPLGEVAVIQRGASPRPISSYLTDNSDGIAWIKIGDTKVNSKYINQTEQRITLEGAKKSRLLKKGDLVLSNSMSYGRPYILNINGAIHDGWASISDFESYLNTDYLYHYLSSTYVQNYWESKINSGSVSNLNSEIIKSLPIPIPPLAEQQRIVAILDKFETLTNSLTEGLPLLIQQSEKRYQYYREQLLDFDE